MNEVDISRYAESPGEGLLRLHDECVEGKTEININWSKLKTIVNDRVAPLLVFWYP